MKKYYEIKISLEENSIAMDANGNYVISTGIELIDGGIFIANTNSWNITAEDLKYCDIVANKDTIDLQDKSLYRYPKLNLPRQKVDLLKDKFNLKVVRNKDKADYHVISHKFLGSLFHNNWNTAISFKDLYKVFQTWKENNLLGETALLKCRDILELERDAMFLIHRPGYYYGSKSDDYDKFCDNVLEPVSAAKKPYETNRIFSVNPSEVNSFKDMVGSKKLIMDGQLLDIIDEDLAVIDNTQYEQIEKMINSSDRDNRNMAVEMIANCNINKSFDVVSGIYWWHYDWFKDTDHWNSVNVKAMRQQLKDYEGGHSNSGIYSYNAYIEKLAKDGKLTKFAVDRTREKLMKDFLGQYVGKSAQVFAVDLDNLKLNEKFEKQVIDE